MERVVQRLGERAGHNVSKRLAGPEKTIAGADLGMRSGYGCCRDAAPSPTDQTVFCP
jgi:hypothetical protein